MTGLARGHGKVAHSRGERDERFLFAVLLELGFLCLLRPGELFRLKHSDFCIPWNVFPEPSTRCGACRVPKEP